MSGRKVSDFGWGGGYMPNLQLQIHAVLILMTSRGIIWDLRLRISDLWNRFALTISD
ncbi:hypothetical protein D1AOALGA4SA_4935 [Olavius algarvensis Delta 1 endosymbiont]|nr:hypothetical protein D1AOALGA4SA_4935 [Olavius algarvensis Delta 1 endosymbiont]